MKESNAEERETLGIRSSLNTSSKAAKATTTILEISGKARKPIGDIWPCQGRPKRIFSLSAETQYSDKFFS